MKKSNISVIGLGGIAQKVYLPILTKEESWNLVGAYTPNAEKRKDICRMYRIKELASVEEAMASSDAVFVHSSTASHYEIVSALLHAGKDVYVDKPLAASLEDARKLAALSKEKGQKLMVGFNRRFAPFYRYLKENVGKLSAVSIEKHRSSSVGPHPAEFTLLDDYIHLIDTACWLAGGNLRLIHDHTEVNLQGHLIFAQHTFIAENNCLFTTSMHRKSGTSRETVSAIAEGRTIQVNNLNSLREEKDDKVISQTAPAWDSVLKQKGFVDCVNHFIECVSLDCAPEVDGFAAVRSQEIIQEIICGLGGLHE